MDQTLIIFSSIALGSVAALCITLVVVAIRAGKNLDRITTTLENVGSDVAQLRAQALPLIEEATAVMHRADATIARVDEGLAQINRGTEVYASIANDVRDLERDLVSKVKPSLEDFASLFSGTLRSVTGFVRGLLDR